MRPRIKGAASTRRRQEASRREEISKVSIVARRQADEEEVRRRGRQAACELRAETSGNGTCRGQHDKSHAERHEHGARHSLPARDRLVQASAASGVTRRGYRSHDGGQQPADADKERGQARDHR